MAFVAWATTVAITSLGWRTMAFVAGNTTATMPSAVATASALVEWAAGAKNLSRNS
jgi:hypothetical protein